MFRRSLARSAQKRSTPLLPEARSIAGLLEARARTRVYVTPPSILHPGHMRTVRMMPDSSVHSTEGGHIAPPKAMLKAAASHLSPLFPTPTQTVVKHESPGLKAEAIWEPRPTEHVFERNDPKTLAVDSPGHREHSRYSQDTDCVAEALRAAKLRSSEHSLPSHWGRVDAAMRELTHSGFKQTP
jgi:hypothetical protein